MRIPKIVFSRTLDRLEGNPRLAGAPLPAEVAAALGATDNDVSILGAGLAAQVIELGLVDGPRVFRVPLADEASRVYSRPTHSWRCARMRVMVKGLIAATMALLLVGTAAMADVRLTNDFSGGGYVSDYTLTTGNAYTDAVLAECSNAQGRQNEPAVAIDPRETGVIVGSSNDYCGVYDATDTDGTPLALGPIWLGYYRSENSGTSFRSSLVPGYPGDISPYAARSHTRVASLGDPVLAWDSHGRLFAGSEASEDPAGSAKGFGDEVVATFVNPGGSGSAHIDDGKEFARTVTVAKGSSAPGIGGKFNDKTAIEVDRTGGACDGNVYFAWSLYNGSGGNTIAFARSTDHGQTFSSPVNLGPVNTEVQFPDIAVTGNGHVYVTFRQFGKKNVADAILVVKSTNCGRTFGKPHTIRTFTPFDARDTAAPEASLKPFDPRGRDLFLDSEATPDATNVDCGSLDAHCESNYVFFRHDTQVRTTADQSDSSSENLYLVYDASVPDSEVATGTTYYTESPGVGSQGAIYFERYDGATGAKTAPKRIAPETVGHQVFPDIALSGGVLHTLWYDSHFDPAYSPARPIGNFADATQSAAALDVFASTSPDAGVTWDTATRLTDSTTQPNWEQFQNRVVPFAGDYLWIDSQGSETFGTWTDWRNTVAGTDPREPASDLTGADVKQCRTVTDGVVGPDTCPRDGGLGQDIYGDQAP